MWKLPTVGPIAGIDCLSILQHATTTAYSSCTRAGSRWFRSIFVHFVSSLASSTTSHGGMGHIVCPQGGLQLQVPALPSVLPPAAQGRPYVGCTQSETKPQIQIRKLFLLNSFYSFYSVSLNGLFQSLTSKNRSVKLVVPPKPRQVLQSFEQLVLITITLVWGLNFLIHSAKKMVMLTAVCDLPSCTGAHLFQLRYNVVSRCPGIPWYSMVFHDMGLCQNPLRQSHHTNLPNCIRHSITII